MNIKFYKVSVGDKFQIASADQAMDVADEMVKAAGGNVIPDIKPCDEQGNIVELEVEEPEVGSKRHIVPADFLTTQDKVNSPVYSDWSKPTVDQDAKARIEGLHSAIAKAGGPVINTEEQYFATGTRMAKEGYDTQRKREREHFEQPLLAVAIEQLRETVSNEMRRDFKMSSKDIANLIEVEDNQIQVKDHLLTERALRGIITRIESPALGYLLGLRERAAGQSTLSGDGAQNNVVSDVNMLADILRYECLRNPDVEFKLRMREFPGDIYAALSPTFAVADAPMVMNQIQEEMPAGARGSWAYDQETTAWELKLSIWTPTPTDEQAVGEPFEGYVSLSSRDAGNGAFNGGGGINLVRCLNASTYSAGEADLRRTHRGSNMLFDVKGMIARSLNAIHTLCQAWGTARKDEVELPTGLTLEQAMPGFWRSLLKEGELVGVIPGRKENHVKGLAKAYFDERRDTEKLVKADFAQGFTRYIQDQPTEVRREAELAIGSWLVKPPKVIRCDLKG